MLARERSLMKIGEIAAKSGVAIKTIRYYEELGLINASERTEGHFRLFDPDVIQRLGFIKRLQSLGLSLQEIGECLTVYDRGNLPCGDIKDKLEEQVAQIDRKIAELQQLRQEVTGILQEWSIPPHKQPEVICPNLHI